MVKKVAVSGRSKLWVRRFLISVNSRLKIATPVLKERHSILQKEMESLIKKKSNRNDLFVAPDFGVSSVERFKAGVRTIKNEFAPTENFDLSEQSFFGAIG
jgi:hypothetical protein